MAWFRRLWHEALFSEMNPIIELGSKQSLQPNDLPVLPQNLEPTTPVFDENKIDWSSGPKLLRSLMTNQKRQWLSGMAFYMANAALNLTGPVLVNLFIKRLEAGVNTPAALCYALIYGLCIGGSGILAGLCIQHYFNLNLRRIQMVINVVNTRIFRHALNLSQSARQRIPVGDIVNHLSTDTDSVSEVGNALADLIYSCVMMFGAVGLLFYYMGSTAWIAVVLLGLLAPLTRKVSRDFTRYDEDLMKHRDTRVSLMAQILSAIRLVKYFVWEDSIGEEVGRVRAEELAARRRIARAELIVTLLYVSVGTMVLFAVLALHSWRGGSFEPALIFTCVSLFSLLEDPFAFMSRVISVLINAKVGGDRVAKFLKEPEILTSTGSNGIERFPIGFETNDLTVYHGETRGLAGVSLRLEPGQSLAVVGPVGSGKSTFIHALLGEVERSRGDLHFFDEEGRCRGSNRIGYVPQEAYILNGTLLENLTFGQELAAERIQHALQVAGLWPDVQAMPGGWMTEIGEKGINMSGGQRQRLSLARAVLHEPQLVVLDDPLSAVDPATEDYLAHHLIFGEWKNLTRVAITHRLGHLDKFDRIAFLESGRLLGFGTFAELQATCAEFRAYLEECSHSVTPPSGEVKLQAAASGEAARITEDEDRHYGAVGGGVYWDYIRSLGG